MPTREQAPHFEWRAKRPVRENEPSLACRSRVTSHYIPQMESLLAGYFCVNTTLRQLLEREQTKYSRILLIRSERFSIKRGVSIKLVEFKENVRAFFPQGQSKLSVIKRCPYKARLDCTIQLLLPSQRSLPLKVL